MKTCNKCKQNKPLTEYTRKKASKDGYNYICKQCRKQYHLDNKDKVKKYVDEYNKKYVLPVESRLKQNEYVKKWNIEKKKSSPIHKLKSIIYRANKRGLTHKKSKHSLEIVGLESWDLLKQHIESLWSEGMNWDNWGRGENKWVIDHKIPLALAKTEEEIYQLNHYLNLQPMWWRENMMKGVKQQLQYYEKNN